MCQGPGRAQRIGEGEADLQGARGEVVEDTLGQGGLAAEEVRKTGKVQPQTLWSGDIFHTHQGAELPAGFGEFFEGAVVGGGIVGLGAEGGFQCRGLGQGHAGDDSAGACGRRGVCHATRAPRGFVEHEDCRMFKLRPRDGDPLDRPVGKPDAECASHR